MKIIILSVLLLSIAVAATSSYQLDDEQENNDVLDFDLMDERPLRPCSNIFGMTFCFDCRPLCSKKNLKCGRLSNKTHKGICLDCHYRCLKNRLSRKISHVQVINDIY